jgi:TonB family protein
MPTSEPPVDVKDPQATGPESPARETVIPGSILGLDTISQYDRERQDIPPAESGESPVVRGSRWLDYDTHELMQMIGELEDERRWSRLREGIWLALLIHVVLLSAVTWIPTYVFKVPKVIDPFDAIKQRKDLTYLDLPADALRQIEKPKPQPLPKEKQLIDKKTLDEMNREAPPKLTEPAPKQEEQQAPAPAPVIQPNPQAQAQAEAPKPAEQPNFAMNSSNPADSLREAMKNAMKGQSASSGNRTSGGLARHPGAGSGGVDVLSDTQGVDFSSWLQRWHYETERTWDPLIPDEVNPPILKSGMVAIRFKVLPNGRVTEMTLEGRSGDTALDRAAWGALTGSNYPPLPKDFHGPYLELRAYFLYNMEPRRSR